MKLNRLLRGSVQSDDKINTSWKPGRMWTKCGGKHAPPTGKPCQVAKGPQQTEPTSTASNPALQLSQVVIPGPSQSRVPPNGSPVEVPPVGMANRTVQERMDMLANTVSSMAHTMKAMQKVNRATC